MDFLGKKDDEPSMTEKSDQNNLKNVVVNALHTRGEFRVCDLTSTG